MSHRSDPMVPILGTAVTVLVIGAAIFVFYPAYRQWSARDAVAVVGHPPSPTEAVPVWVCRTEPGVALLLDAGAPDDPAVAGALAARFRGGVDHFLRLSVYNFSGPDPFALPLPAAGFTSPEGGFSALPAIASLEGELTPKEMVVLRGLGGSTVLEVPRGRRGQALLVIKGDPAARTAFVSGGLTFTRRMVTREMLAAWQAEPDLKAFEDL